jgi:pimeloyl-ACP methyl ester carboxylesterase
MASLMARRQPSCRLVTLAGAGHQLPFARPVELAALLLERALASG